MSTTIRISDGAYERLVLKAAGERRTITAVVDEWLSVPVSVGVDVATADDRTVVGVLERESPEEKAEPVSQEPLSDADPKCAGCGHEARKHTPKCYVAGCNCRKFRAEPS